MPLKSQKRYDMTVYGYSRHEVDAGTWVETIRVGLSF